jgi:hypothetical protein
MLQDCSQSARELSVYAPTGPHSHLLGVGGACSVQVGCGKNIDKANHLSKCGPDENEAPDARLPRS